MHPLIELANGREVKQAAAFAKAAAELGGEQLAALYEREVTNAPRREDADKKYLVAHNTKLASARRPNRDDEHAAIALVAHCRANGGLALPDDEGALELLHPLIPLKSAQPDRERGVEDPNSGVGRIDLLGIGPEDRMVVTQLRYAAPSTKRVGVGDTPLRALLEGLANCAIASANREALQRELGARGVRPFADDPPLLALIGSRQYWTLCRKRSTQKGAAWIKQLLRLAEEVERDIGVTVRFLRLELEGDPGWSYPEGAPALDVPPRLSPAWEPGAGRVKPKPRPRPKAQDPADIVVEADLSRPVRPYALTECFQAGDRIQHPTLGEGVVQGEAGRGKIQVLFDGKKSLLVHDRPTPSAPG